MAFYVGLDLGQVSDYTALSVVEATDPVYDDLFPRPSQYAVRYLQRWPLGTPYTTIVKNVASLLDRPPLLQGCALVLDNTGVGRAVSDLFRQSLSDHSRRVNLPKLVPVTITAGFHATKQKGGWHVPKKDLAGVLSVLMSQRRFTIANLPDRNTLLRELRTFKVKVSTTTGNESFEHWRQKDHDDILFAVALPCWYAERAAPGQLSFRVIRLRGKEDKNPRIVVASEETLKELAFAGSGILCSIQEPGSDPQLPAHAISPLLDSLILQYTDIDPADYQARWNEPIPPYGKPCQDLMMSKDHGRRLWSFLLKKRNSNPEVIAISDNKGRGQSTALAICDQLGYPRTAIYLADQPDRKVEKTDKPQNGYVYAMVRDCRGMVVG